MIHLNKESSGYSVSSSFRGEHLSLSPLYKKKSQALDNIRKQAQAWSDYFGHIYFKDYMDKTWRLEVKTGIIKQVKIKA